MYKRLMVKVCLCLCVAAVCRQLNASEFKIVPMDDEMFGQMGNYGMTVIIDGNKSAKITKEPEYAGKVAYGLVRGSRGTLSAVSVTGSTTSDVPVQLIIDANGNNDLSDDSILNIPSGTGKGEGQTVKFLDGREARVRVSKYPHRAKQQIYMISTAEMLKGVITVGGVERAAVVVDPQMDGLCVSNSQDVFLYDVNGDGKISFERFKGPEGYMAMSKVMFIGSAFYSCTVNSGTRDISLVPYSGPLSSVNLEVKAGDGSRLKITGGHAGDRESMFGIPASDAASVVLPSGKYRYININAAIEANGSPKASLSFKANNELVLEKDKPLTVKLDKDTPLSLDLRQEGRRLKMSTVIKDSALGLSSITFGKVRPKPQIKIIVKDGQKERVIAEACQEYG